MKILKLKFSVVQYLALGVLTTMSTYGCNENTDYGDMRLWNKFGTNLTIGRADIYPIDNEGVMVPLEHERLEEVFNEADRSKISGLKQIKTLKMADLGLSLDRRMPVGSKFISLVELCIQENNLGSKGSKNLSQSHMPALQILVISKNRIGDSGLAHIGKASWHNLKEFFACDNNISHFKPFTYLCSKVLELICLNNNVCCKRLAPFKDLLLMNESIPRTIVLVSSTVARSFEEDKMSEGKRSRLLEMIDAKDIQILDIFNIVLGPNLAHVAQNHEQIRMGIRHRYTCSLI
jgi:hypothetical protein